MNPIKNFNSLATNPLRKICLEIIEEGFKSTQADKIVQKNISITNSILKIQDKQFNLKDFNRVFLLGFGKGSASISKHIEKLPGNFLTKGYVIDVGQEKFTNIEFTQGTHPLPSQQNVSFTKRVIEQFNNLLVDRQGLTIRDLVIVVIAGGGSALFESPYKATLEKLIEVNKALLKSGANITEMNILRKHLSKVKGGGLAKLLYPAKIISLIASDVPGNDLSVIASGPTVKDPSTKEQAFEVLTKYTLWNKLNLSKNDFLETPKNDKYFENVSNILILSNKTALLAMQEKAKILGFKTIIYSDRLQGEARRVGENLIKKTPSHTVLLAGGETTVKVKGKGIGGRNQELVLGALSNLTSEQPARRSLGAGGLNNLVISSFDSDGWDNSSFAGAIGDVQTLEKAKKLRLNPKRFLDINDSFHFFEKVKDGIITDRLPSNVSDLMMVVKK